MPSCDFWEMERQRRQRSYLIGTHFMSFQWVYTHLLHTHSLLCGDLRVLCIISSYAIQQTVLGECFFYYSVQFVIHFEAIIHAFTNKVFGFWHIPSWKNSIAQNVLVCWNIKNSLHWNYGKNSPIPLSRLHQSKLYSWPKIIQTGNALLASAKPRLAHQAAKQREA